MAVVDLDSDESIMAKALTEEDLDEINEILQEEERNFVEKSSIEQHRLDAYWSRISFGAAFDDAGCSVCGSPLEGKILFWSLAAGDLTSHIGCVKALTAGVVKDIDAASPPKGTQNLTTRRIKGDLGEIICRNHFRAAGYRVDSFGIENIGRDFFEQAGNGDGIYLTGFALTVVKRLPDFLVSWNYADGLLAGKRDAFFVETKFCSTLEMTDKGEEIFKHYKLLLESGVPLMIYAVTRRAHLHGKLRPGRAFVNYRKLDDNGEFTKLDWIRVSDTSDSLPTANALKGHRSFAQVGDTIIEPTLSEILGFLS